MNFLVCVCILINLYLYMKMYVYLLEKMNREKLVGWIILIIIWVGES